MTVPFGPLRQKTKPSAASGPSPRQNHRQNGPSKAAIKTGAPFAPLLSPPLMRGEQVQDVYFKQPYVKLSGFCQSVITKCV